MNVDSGFFDKNVLIIGAKRSGVAAAELLRRQSAHVRVMDSGELSSGERARFNALGVPVLTQSKCAIAVDGRYPDWIILSPGVPYDLDLLDDARDRGVPAIGEIELASYFLRGPVIGITGSNGKTTATALIGHILKCCGVACQVGGNIGTPATSLIESSKETQWNVLELSSFQLESICRFQAAIAVCLNVTPDHLDRHHTFEKYAAAKARLFATQQNTDCAVLNHDDSVCRRFATETKAGVYWFSLTQRVPQGIFFDGDDLCFDLEPFMTRSQIRLRGAHNIENVMAACLAAHLAGAKLDQLGAAVESFPGVEHRIEFVRDLDGVSYFNDSKATNVDAALKAIAAFPSGLWIILGGKDKGSDYMPLRAPLQQGAKAALLIGADPPYPHAAAPLIKKALTEVLPLVDCGTLEQAVRYAREHAQPGDIVLLAPACASFDQFQNFEERGNRFKQLVSELL